MQGFTIGDIETLTGIKASMLRVWEQRYKVITPKRKENLRRFYEARDLKKLLHAASLYKNGHSLTEIATLSQQQLAELAKKIKVTAIHPSLFVHQLIEAALDFDEYQFLAVLNSTIEQMGLKNCIANVCYIYLLKLDQLTATGSLTPSLKLFSIPIIQNRIITETEKIVLKSREKPEILLLCPVRESYVLPLLFLHYLLKVNGWSVLYLGTNAKLDDLGPVVHLPHIKYLYLHIPAHPGGPDADAYFERICKKIRNKKIFASGEGIQKMQRNFVNLTLLKTDEQIYSFIEGNNEHRQSRFP